MEKGRGGTSTKRIVRNDFKAYFLVANYFFLLRVAYSKRFVIDKPFKNFCRIKNIKMVFFMARVVSCIGVEKMQGIYNYRRWGC